MAYKKCFISLSITLLLLLSSCDKENSSVDGTSEPPFDSEVPYSWPKWFRTNVPSDSIVIFIGDGRKEIRIKSNVPTTIRNHDIFIASSKITFSLNAGDQHSKTIDIEPRFVGETALTVSGAEDSTVINIKVLGEYYTYTEPELDFDDTEDSVYEKLHKQFGRITYCVFNNQESYYHIKDSRCNYNLYVNYDGNGNIDNYVVDFYEGVDAAELFSFINERYVECNINGQRTYIKTHNILNWTAFSDITKAIIIPDDDAHRVIYQNPLAYENTKETKH